MNEAKEILTVRVVAEELRCWVAHVYAVIYGRVFHLCRQYQWERGGLSKGKPFEECKRTNETGTISAMISMPKN